MSAFQPSPPNDLAIPRGGSMTGRAILSMSLRKLFDDLRALRLADLPAPLARDYRALRTTLVSFLPGNPGAIASLLRSPSVAAPLRCLRDGRGDFEQSALQFVHQSFFQLALQDALDGPQELESIVPTWMSPVLGKSALGAHRVGSDMSATSEHYVEVDSTEAGAVYLATLDNNPLQLAEAHPDKSGNAIDLGGESVERWIAALRQALDLIGLFLPALRREAGLFIRQFVPVGYDAERHLSATYQEAIGTIYLSLHPDPMTMAEAVIHELSHTKLNALLELDPVLLNDHSEAYPSPVRPDPRPLHGVLLAVHAFVPVAYLYEKMKAADHPLASGPRFAARYQEIVAGNADGYSVLASHARPTAVGRGVLDELGRRTGKSTD